jgi:hypothetical protein
LETTSQFALKGLNLNNLRQSRGKST